MNLRFRGSLSSTICCVGLISGCSVPQGTEVHAFPQNPGDPGAAAPAAPVAAQQSAPTGIRISATEAKTIGQKIWQNECGGTVRGLTSWNAGENFASLGIGHFIWFPAGVSAPYEESFPPLIAFMKSRRVAMPGWLASTPDCPWRSKADFERAANSPQMVELRNFLKNTIPLQTEFILKRLEAALPKMLGAVPPNQRDLVRGRFYAVASTGKGKYALMDYVNFKGEGTNPKERYKGQGWGMLQVLQDMRGTPTGAAATNEFANAGIRVLTRRVSNAPRKESQWLPGWTNRCNTYRP